MIYVFLTIIVVLLLDIRLDLLKKTYQRRNKAVVMDSSALIDARILDIVKTGFIAQKIIIPKIVVNELQLLADGRDAFKRERARLGLDVANELMLLKNVRVVSNGYKLKQNEKTDTALVHIARTLKASLCTTDFNLNKVAMTEGVTVLNVNELAQVMRPKMLPGEIIEVKIMQKGESHLQGVGYLEDGTMTVVDGAYKYKGEFVKATVDRMIQTKAGKMIFAHMLVASKK